MRPSQVIPAQIRAARALLEWSQETLSQKAGVALSTVRDFENQRRPDESQVAGAMLAALEEGGVTFVSGDQQYGPGVRLVGDRPNIIRRPAFIAQVDEVRFDVEWRGSRLTIFISSDDIADLGQLSGDISKPEYLDVVDDNMGRILDGLRTALLNGVQPNRQGIFRLPGEYIRYQ